MGKSTLNKYKRYDYEEEEEYSSTLKSIDKRKQKRVERALRIKDISTLVEMENEGTDPIDYEQDIDDNLEFMKVQWK